MSPLVLTAVLFALAPPEREEALAPRHPGDLVPTRAGDLYVLEPRGDGAGLRRLTRDGPVEFVSTPFLPSRVAWSEADGLWLCSETRVAHRRADGTWHTVEVPQARGETVALLVLGPDHVALVRQVWEVGSEVLHVGEGGVTKTESLGGKVRLTTPVVDGAGSWWATLSIPYSERTGFVRVRDGEWRAWTSDGKWPDDAPTPEGFSLAGTAQPGVGGDTARSFLAPAREGFFQRTQLRQLQAVRGDGTSRALDVGPSGRVLQSLAFDGARDELVLISGGREAYGLDDFGPTFPLELTRLSAEGAERERVPVPLPEWFEDGGPGRVAVAGDVTWVAFTDGVFLARRDGAWSAVVSAPFKAEVVGKRREARTGLLTSIGLALLGGTLALGAGALTSGVRSAPWYEGGVETLAGGLLALAPALMVSELSPFSHSWNVPGGGLAIALMGLVVFVPASTLAAGFGAWGAGQLAFPAERSGAGLGGALLGALAGTALYLVVDALFARVPGGEVFSRALGAGLLGASATLGYQLLRGPRVR
ncbi:MAG: hypothetical protein ACOZQL_37945 [Myxococcota bacterium]